MVSEDSQNLGWLPMIHRLGDARDEVNDEQWEQRNHEPAQEWQ